jgi:hypothetical protein
MKIQTFAPLLVACLTMFHTAHAQVPKLEQKTAFCATSIELPRKRDSNDVYLCETSARTCGPYLKPSCLDDAKQGDWEVASATRQTLLRDFANIPCSCVGTQYVLTRKATTAAIPPVVNTAPVAAVAAPAALPVAAPPATPTVAAISTPPGSLASEVEGLKQDNVQIKRQLDQLQRQFDELRRELLTKK